MGEKNWKGSEEESQWKESALPSTQAPLVFFLLLASHFPQPPNWLAEHVSERWVDPSSTSWQSFAQLQLCDVPRSCTTTPLLS